jgi:hypothetical protein
MALLAAFCTVATVAGYLIVHFTHAFIGDFRAPVWERFKLRIWLANIVVPLFLLVAVGACASAAVTVLMGLSGASPGMPSVIPFFVVLVVGQVALSAVHVWRPVRISVIKNRLLARGVPLDRLDQGMYAGVSDPDSKTLKRQFVEQDIGMLWVAPDRIAYVGDDEKWDFEATRESLMAVERGVDKGSWAAYWGASDVILRIRCPDGTERRVRLHPQACWTMTGIGKALDRLAEELDAWKKKSQTPMTNQCPNSKSQETDEEPRSRQW